MLPFDKRPWAPRLAKTVIVFTILAEIAVALWLRRSGPLDPPEWVALFLILVAVIPPNIHIARRKTVPSSPTGASLNSPAIPIRK